MPAAFAAARAVRPPHGGGGRPAAPAGLSALELALADFGAAPASAQTFPAVPPVPPVLAPFGGAPDAHPAFEPPADAFPFGPEPDPAPAFAPPPSGPDVDALVAEAVVAAEHALRAALEAEHAAALEAALSAERQRHAFVLEMEVHTLCGAAADALASGFARFSGAVAAQTEAACARALLPLAGDALARRACAALAALLTDTLASGEGAPRVTISGPRRLLDALDARLENRVPHVQWREADTPDLVASLDTAVVETRLNEWSARLRAEIEEACS